MSHNNTFTTSYSHEPGGSYTTLDCCTSGIYYTAPEGSRIGMLLLYNVYMELTDPSLLWGCNNFHSAIFHENEANQPRFVPPLGFLLQGGSEQQILQKIRRHRMTCFYRRCNWSSPIIHRPYIALHDLRAEARILLPYERFLRNKMQFWMAQKYLHGNMNGCLQQQLFRMNVRNFFDFYYLLLFIDCIRKK